MRLSAEERGKLLDELSAYAQTDLLCYFAEEEALRARQQALWEPVLQWAERHFEATIVRTQGIMPVAQAEALSLGVRRELEAINDTKLVAMAALITGLGSVLLALALSHRAFDWETVWQAAQLDETYQAEQWGEDEEATAARAEKAAALAAAHRYVLGLGE